MHTYLRLVLDRFDCYGAWLPNAKIKVGAIGRLIGGGSLYQTGDIGRRTDAQLPEISLVKEAPLQALVGATASRAGGAAIDTSQIVQAVAGASAGVTMTMAKRNSAALVLDQVTRQQFSDERAVRDLMDEMLRRGDIDRDEVVVTYVLEAGSGVVAASSANDTSMDGHAGVDLGVGTFKLGMVKGRLAIVSGETSDVVAVAEKGAPLTPMYRVLFFRGSRVWWQFWNKTYTVEALIGAAASLRGFTGRRAHSTGRLNRQGLFTSYLLESASEVVSSSLPSLSLAEQALQELGDAGLSTGVLASSLGLSVGLDEEVEMSGEVRLVRLADTHSKLGDVLEAHGDLAGAQEHYERAIKWAKLDRSGKAEDAGAATDEPQEGTADVSA